MVKSKRKRIRMTGTMKKQQLLRWVAGRPNSQFPSILLYTLLHFYTFPSIFYILLYIFLWFTIIFSSILLVFPYFTIHFPQFIIYSILLFILSSTLPINLYPYLYLSLIHPHIPLLIDLYKNIWYNKRKMIGDFICLIMI